MHTKVKDIHHIIMNTDEGFKYNDQTKDNDFAILKLGSPLILNKDGDDDEEQEDFWG